MNVDTSKTFIGQEFKNLQELSVVLTGERIPKGSGYALRVKHLQKYLSWTPVAGTRKVIITEIYDTPKVVSVRGIYTPQLLANLYTLELGKKYTIYDLYEKLGLTSKRFFSPRYFVDNMNKIKVSPPIYKFLHTQIEQVINQTFTTILKRQCSKGLISYNKTYQFEFHNGYPTVDIPNELMEELKQKALQSCGFNTEWEAFHSRKKNQYKSIILDGLQKYNVKRYWTAYVFTEFNPPKYLLPPSELKMNQLIVGMLKKHFEKNTSIQSTHLNQINPLIDYTVSL